MSIANSRILQRLLACAMFALVVAGCVAPVAAPGGSGAIQPTDAAISPANTSIPPTAAPVPTDTPAPATITPVPTDTPAPTDTAAPTEPPTSTPAATALPADPAVSTMAEPGWTLSQDDAEGFSIALAPKWKRIDLDADSLDAVVDVIAEQDPGIKSMLSSQLGAQAMAGIKFFALDLAPEAIGTDFMTNLNIVHQTLPSKVSLAVIVQVNVGMLENLESVVKPVTHKQVQIGHMDAEQVNYGMRMSSASGDSFLLAGTQYYFLADQEVYVITFSTTADHASGYAPIFEKMAASFRLLP